jgi:predicted N-acetyltransferase YhbS
MPSSVSVDYARVAPDELDVAAVAAVYERSTLAERRPVADRERLRAMLLGANLILVARCGGDLVGICRSLSDFSYVTYLADLAVDVRFQRQGIGRELIRLTRLAVPHAKVVLLSAPAATSYYPHVGFTRHESAWTLGALQ